MSVPVLRAGFGLDFDSNNAIAAHLTAMLLCCFTEVFRSAHAVAQLYTAHQLLVARTNSGEPITDVAEIDRHITVAHLIRGLHHQAMNNSGAVQQIKPLYAFIATHHSMPDEASDYVSLEWLQRLLKHYDGARSCLRNARPEEVFSHALMMAMMTGKNATEILSERHKEEGDDVSSIDEDGSGSDAADDVDDDDEDRDTDCDCEQCKAVDSCHSGWVDWIPADEFDEKIKEIVNNIEKGLLSAVDEINAQQNDDGDEKEN